MPKYLVVKTSIGTSVSVMFKGRMNAVYRLGDVTEKEIEQMKSEALKAL